MPRLTTVILTLTAMLMAAFSTHAEAQSTGGDNPRDTVPEKISFEVPYGAPVTFDQSQAVLRAAIDEAAKHGWKISFAVYGSGGNVVAVARMNGAQLSSPQIAEHKAQSSVTFRRPTIFYENGVHNNQLYQLSVDGVIASRGGIPLIEDGRLIGAIGAAGGAGSQDQMCAEAGAAVINSRKENP